MGSVHEGAQARARRQALPAVGACDDAFDWPDFWSRADYHGLTTIAVAEMRRPIPVAPAALSEGERRLQRTAHLNLLRAAEAGRVWRTLMDADVRSLIVKGPTLAVLAYTNVADRPINDLDFLIEPSQSQRAESALLAAGYIPQWSADGPEARMIKPRVGAAVFFHEKLPVAIDLHRQLTLGWQDPIWSFDELWRRRTDVVVGGVSLPTLGRNDLLLYLLIHGSKPDHAWARVGWLLDVALLTQNEPVIDWGGIWRRAEAHGFGRSVRLGLLLAERVFECPVPSQIADAVRADSVASELAEEIRQRLGKTVAELERDDWVFRRRFISRIIERRRDRVRQFVDYLICPTLKEMEFVRLPRWLSPAYVPLRIARLAWLAARWPIGRLLVGR